MELFPGPYAFTWAAMRLVQGMSGWRPPGRGAGARGVDAHARRGTPAARRHTSDQRIGSTLRTKRGERIIGLGPRILTTQGHRKGWPSSCGGQWVFPERRTRRALARLRRPYVAAGRTLILRQTVRGVPTETNGTTDRSCPLERTPQYGHSQTSRCGRRA